MVDNELVPYQLFELGNPQKMQDNVLYSVPEARIVNLDHKGMERARYSRLKMRIRRNGETIDQGLALNIVRLKKDMVAPKTPSFKR
jgi:hypothetical protein